MRRLLIHNSINNALRALCIAAVAGLCACSSKSSESQYNGSAGTQRTEVSTAIRRKLSKYETNWSVSSLIASGVDLKGRPAMALDGVTALVADGNSLIGLELEEKFDGSAGEKRLLLGDGMLWSVSGRQASLLKISRGSKGNVQEAIPVPYPKALTQQRAEVKIVGYGQDFLFLYSKGTILALSSADQSQSRSISVPAGVNVLSVGQTISGTIWYLTPEDLNFMSSDSSRPGADAETISLKSLGFDQVPLSIGGKLAIDRDDKGDPRVRFASTILWADTEGLYWAQKDESEAAEASKEAVSWSQIQKVASDACVRCHGAEGRFGWGPASMESAWIDNKDRVKKRISENSMPPPGSSEEKSLTAENRKKLLEFLSQ